MKEHMEEKEEQERIQKERLEKRIQFRRELELPLESSSSLLSEQS